MIVDKYDYLICKEGLLESGSIELVKLITAALKPTSYIKLIRELIAILAILLAGILSVFIALMYHFLMRKE